MFDIGHLQKMQTQMQDRLSTMSGELADERVEGSAGGGALTVVCDGNQKILSAEIKKGVIELDDDDLEMLQDLMIAACNQAIQRSKEISEKKLNKITGGMRLPGLSF